MYKLGMGTALIWEWKGMGELYDELRLHEIDRADQVLQAYSRCMNYIHFKSTRLWMLRSLGGALEMNLGLRLDWSRELDWHQVCPYTEVYMLNANTQYAWTRYL